MPEIQIDGKSYQVKEGKNLLEVCQDLKLELPYFCWHPALGSVGSCRQCAVLMFQNEEDQNGRITMACMTPVAEGQILSLKAPKVEKFRASLIEATMTNHPHDCPVCEEAGECHLQDMTLLSGHIERRYEGPKRTHNNQYLGPFINHEMNRCISCYRCVRFYRDYSGGTDLNVFASRNNVYFGRAEDGPLESEFSGNLAEVCPTGVFTDKTYSQHYTRKWELQSAPSICTHCSVGCNIYPGERSGILRRITNRFNPDINGHFLCDRGRFGYEFVNHNERASKPWQRNYSTQSTDILGIEAASDALHRLVKDNTNIMAIGSSRSSLENNFALLSLMGEDNFYADSQAAEFKQFRLLLEHYQHIQNSSTLSDLEKSDAALMIGSDLTQTAPRMALSLRQMTKNAGIKKASEIGVQYWSAAEVKNITQQLTSPLHIISTHATRLDDVAESTSFIHPREQILLINRVTGLLTVDSEESSSIENSPNDNNTLNNIALENQAIQIAKNLKEADLPFIVTSVNMVDEKILAATLQLSEALHKLNKQSGLICATNHVNSLGLSQLCKPENHLSKAANHLDAALARLEQSHALETLIIMETDLYRYYAAETLDRVLDKVKSIIVLDHLLTPTALKADLLLPTTSFAEYHGSWVNFEGRLQASTSCFPANEHRHAAHFWLSNGTNFHSIIKDLSGLSENFAELPSLYPVKSNDFNLARKTIRSSGRTAQRAFIDIKEIPPVGDDDSPYQFSPEGVSSHSLGSNRLGSNRLGANKLGTSSTPTQSTPTYIWAPSWNSNESLSQFQDNIHSPIRGTNPGLMLFPHQESSKETSDNSSGNSSNNKDEQQSLIERVYPSSLPEGCFAAVPEHHIFTDEELSSYVSSIRQQQAEPSIKINAHQAGLLGYKSGDQVSISFGQSQTNNLDDSPLSTEALILYIDDEISDGLALVPAPLLQRSLLNSPVLIYLEKAHA